MRILIIGPVPPPYGGISVWVYRLSRKLSNEGHRVKLLDYGRLSRLGRLFALIRILFSRFDRIDVNCSSTGIALLFSVTGLAKKTRFTAHGEGIRGWSSRKRSIMGRFLHKCDKVMLVGKHLRTLYNEYLDEPLENIEISSAFIPPPPEDEKRIVESYSDTILKFTDSRQPLIIANAYRLEFQDDTDLYGLDMCIDLAARLKPDYPNIGLLFALPEIGDYQYFDGMKKRIANLGLSDHFIFLTDQRELWPLFKRADLMVRPTCVDGYGISIAEALHFGCPAVASDVCARTRGTIVFRNRDMDDFEKKCRAALKAQSGKRAKILQRPVQ